MIYIVANTGEPGFNPGYLRFAKPELHHDFLCQQQLEFPTNLLMKYSLCPALLNYSFQ